MVQKRGGATRCVSANKIHSGRFHKPVEEEGVPLGSRWWGHARDMNVVTVTNLQGMKVASIMSGMEEAAGRRGSIFKSCGGWVVM